MMVTAGRGVDVFDVAVSLMVSIVGQNHLIKVTDGLH